MKSILFVFGLSLTLLSCSQSNAAKNADHTITNEMAQIVKESPKSDSELTKDHEVVSIDNDPIVTNIDKTITKIEDSKKSIPVESDVISEVEMVESKIESSTNKASDQISQLKKSAEKISPKVTEPKAPVEPIHTKETDSEEGKNQMPDKPRGEFKQAIEPIKPNKMSKVMLDHDIFNGLLSKYVSASGKVNYSGLKADVALLDTYLQQLNEYDLGTIGKNAQLAFWINAYNAYTLKLILNNWPVKSITDIDGGKPWDSKWIEIQGMKISLNHIEHEIIRKTYKDARIHFAVNCAAKSCPKLLNKAYKASNVQDLLEVNTRAFVNNPNRNIIGADGIVLSKIFEWYKEDFGDLVQYINKYSKIKVNTGANISYKDYDWSLNN